MPTILHFRHYNNKQGLSHNTVYCSLQDQRGFMWFGTEDGLNRFDGHTFKIYRHNSYNPNSLPNDCIVNLFESSDEKIWIFTARGTCYYDYRTDTFHPFRLSSGQNESESFFAGTEDKDRNLWFIRLLTGLSAIILAGQQFTNLSGRRIFPSGYYYPDK